MWDNSKNNVVLEEELVKEDGGEQKTGEKEKGKRHVTKAEHKRMY